MNPCHRERGQVQGQGKNEGEMQFLVEETWMNKQVGKVCSLKRRQDKVEQGKVREKARVSRIQTALKKEEGLNFQNNLTILFSYLIGEEKAMEWLQWNAEKERMKGLTFVHLSVMEVSSQFIPYSQRACAY